MLREWLEHTERNSNDFQYKINDILEIEPRNIEKISEIFSKILIDNIIGYEKIKELASNIGWEKTISKYIEPKISKKQNMQKGKFGEMLASSILECFFDYEIPIKKWRHTMSSDQSLPGCDIIAIKLKDDKIIEMTFVESKLYTTTNNQIISKAYKQLMKEKENGFSQMLVFIVTQLMEKDDRLAQKIIEYTSDKNIQNDTYRIASTSDVINWNEVALNNLQEVISEPESNLTVDLIRINDLKNTIKLIYDMKRWAMNE